MPFVGLLSTVVGWGFGAVAPGVLGGVATAGVGPGMTIDAGAFVDCLEGPGVAIPAGCSTANFHPDSQIDLNDFAIIQRDYLLSPGVLEFATETGGEIAPPDDVDEYTFAATFGSTVTVDFITPTVNGRPDLTVRLDLVRPNGTVAATTASCSTNARLDTAAIDATGTWRVRVRAYESWANCGFGADENLRTGVYTLSVCPSDAPAIPISYGQTHTNVFTCDCQIINYEFAGATGDIVSVMYLGPASTRHVRLYAPTGALLATSGSGAGTSISNVILPLDGSYRIAVEASDGQLRAAYSIGLSALSDAAAIARNTLTAASLDRIAEADTFRFDATFGSTVTVDFATPTVDARPDIVARIDLIRPNGSIAATTATCSTKARLDTVLIDTPGTWTVRVQAYESWFNCGYGPDTRLITGSYSLIVCSSDSAPIAIAYGQTRSGTFTVDCQIVNYQFDGVLGDVATIMYLGPASTRRLRLYAPNGTLLATSGSGQGVSLTDVTLPLTGTYVIAAEAADNEPVGDFNIGLSKLGAAVPIDIATATSGALEQAAEVDTYEFAGAFGSTVTVDFSTPQVLSRPDLVIRLDLVRPNGTMAATTASCGTTLRLDTVPVDATGTWTVRVRAYESWFNCGFGADTDLLSGDYTIALCTSNLPATAIAYGETVDGTFNVDCEIVNFEFDGEAGDSVTGLYFGSAVTRRMRLFAPNGALLATSSSGQGAALVGVPLPVGGVYRIAVEAADNQPVGDFSIGLNKLSAAVPLALDTPTPGSLDLPGEADTYSFDSTFGTTVTVDYSTPTVMGMADIVARLDLIRPNGSVAATIATCGGSARLDTVSLDATGTWSARVRVYEAWYNCGFGLNTDLLTGAYTITVSASDSAPTEIGYGETQASEFIVDSQIVNYGFDGLVGDFTTALYYGPAVLRRMRLFAPNGSLLVTSGGGTGAALLDVPLPLDGTYRLAVEAADNQPLGAFSVGLSELHDSSPIILNTATPGAIESVGEVRQYAFARTNGDVVSVNLITPVPGGRPDLAARLDLIRPDGTTAATTASCGETAQLNSITIDQTGSWTARVRAFESWANCGFGADLSLLTGSFMVKVCPGVCP